MAELLSVQVHVPLTKTEDGQLMEKRVANSMMAGGMGGFTRLKKIDNAAQDGTLGTATPAPARFDFLPNRRAVDIEFKGLTYSVSEGRKKGRHPLKLLLLLSSFIGENPMSDHTRIREHSLKIND